VPLTATVATENKKQKTKKKLEQNVKIMKEMNLHFTYLYVSAHNIS